MDNRPNLVITGATKGIGRAIIEHFASIGANVVFCARQKQEVQELENELKVQFPTQVFSGFVADMSVASSRNAFFEHISNVYKRVHVLVNNVGMFIPGNMTQEVEGSLEKMIETNLYSAYYSSRFCLSLMLPFKSGHIFNISSIAGAQAYPNGGSYSISKFALTGMSKVLRMELKDKGIRVTNVVPGATLTASWEGVDLPESRFIKADDVAQAVLATWKLSCNTVVEEIVLRPQLGDI